VINGHQVGIRVPAEFVGQYVKVGYTDSTPADFPSTMAMIEWLMGFPPIGAGTLPDASAYSYHALFNFAQAPTPFVPIATNTISALELKLLDAQPPDGNDPT
jgi:phospholipase C